MPDHLLATIGNKIEELRIEHNISREKLEENCGLKHQSIKKIERNPANTFNVSALCSIADFFDVDVEFLLGKQDVKRRVIADASKVTGLSYEAVRVLASFGKLNQTEIDTLSTFICSPSFLPFIVQLKKYCLLTGESKNLLKDEHSSLTDKDILTATIQNNVSLLMNEVKTASQNELIEKDKKTRAFALIASSIININREVAEADILEALSACGLDAKKEIQAFREYFPEYEKTMKGRE